MDLGGSPGLRTKDKSDGWMDVPASIWNRQGGISQKRKKSIYGFSQPSWPLAGGPWDRIC